MAAGGELVIDDKLVKDFAKLDSVIQNITQHSQQLTTALRDINQQGLTPLIGSISQLVTLTQRKRKNSVIRDVKNDIAATTDNANRFLELMAKINNDGASGRRSSAVTKLNEELEAAKNRLAEIRQLLKFYTKGEGKSAIGFTNLDPIMQESRALMNQIDLLERKKASLQANERLRLTISERQNARDNQWFAMQKNKEDAYRAQIKLQNDLTKARNEAYQAQSIEDRRMYESMYDKGEAKLLAEKRAANTAYYAYSMQKIQEELQSHHKAEQEKVEQARRTYQEKANFYEQLWGRQSQYLNEALALEEKVAQKQREIEATKRVNQQIQPRYTYATDTEKMYAQMFDEAERRLIEQKKKENTAYYNWWLEQQKKQVTANHKYGQEILRQERDWYNQRKALYEKLWGAEAQSAQRRASYNNAMLSGNKQAEHALNYYGRINSGVGVTSINNLNAALQKLRNAQANLNMNTEEGRKKFMQLQQAIAQTESRLESYNRGTRSVNQSHRNLMDTSGQLARKLALVFSVSQVLGYLDKLVAVRKEFERQQKALSVLIGEQIESNKLWNQTLQLAVKSPFRVKELVTYTKQLAAYRIETGKLHDTTRMLADVSAGLGVDMNRLILAYGQVRAAEFLRGTELRQFTEAGIPMLEELADHFSELEGRAVSTADVFDRISKRMVMFADVDAVFRKITSEGGAFYQMQEQQSETLWGMISNLHDSLDLMLNDIGKLHEDKIKGGLTLVKILAENWRSVANALEGVIAAFALYKVAALRSHQATLLLAIDHNILTTTLPKQLTYQQLLTLGWRRMSTAIREAAVATKTFVVANLPLLAATAMIVGISKLISAWREHSEQIEEIEKKYRDLSKQANTIRFKFDFAKDDDEKRAQLQSLIDLAKNELRIRIKMDTSQLSGEALNKAFAEIETQVQQMKGRLQVLSTSFVEQTHWVATDDITEDILELQKAYDTLNNVMLKGQSALYDWLKQNNMLTDQIREGLAPMQQGENDLQYYERIQTAMRNITRLFANPNISKRFWNAASTDAREALNAIRDALQGYDSATREAQREVQNYATDIAAFIKGLPEDEREVTLVAHIDQEASERGWSDFTSNTVRRWIQEAPTINIPFNITPKEEEVEDTPAWRKRVYDAVDAVNKKIRQKYGDKAQKMPLFPLPSDTDSQQSYLNKIKDSIEDAEVNVREGQKILDDNEVLRKEFMKGYTEEVRIIANITKARHNETEANWFSNIGKSIRDTHKDFITLHQDLNQTDALYWAIEKHKDVFQEAAKNVGLNLDLESFANYENAGDAIEGLNALLDIIPEKNKKARLSIQKMIGELTGEDNVRKAEEAMKRISDAIDKAFDTYEISIELDKMGVSPEIANQLFGIESIDLSDLRQQIVDQFNLKDAFGDNLSAGLDTASIVKYAEQVGLAKEQVDALRDSLQKIDEKEDKELLERQQKYLNFLVDQQGKRVKILVQEMRDIEDIQKTFTLTDKKGAQFGLTKDQTSMLNHLFTTNEDLLETQILQLGLDKEKTAQLIEQYQLLKAQKDLALSGVEHTTQEALDKQTWEDFKQSGYYEEMFTDLDNVSNRVLVKLEEKLTDLRSKLGQLPPQAAKEVQSAIDKIEAIKMERNPFKEALNAAKELQQLNSEGITISTGTFKGRKEIENELFAQREKQELLKQEIDTGKSLLTLDEGQRRLALDKLYAEGKSVTYQDMSLEQISATVKKKEKEKKLTDQNVDTLQDCVNTYDTISDKQKKMANTVSEWSDALGNALGSVDQLLEALGEGEDSVTRAMLQAGQAMTEMISQMATLATASNTALGVIGMIAAAVQAVAKIITIFSALHDAKLQVEIDKQAAAVEKLEKAYERLKKQMDSVYNIADIQHVTAERQKNSEAQIASYERMIALEEQKKNSDAEQIKEWREAIEEEKEAMLEAERERKEAVGGFGNQEDYKEASTAFVEAWLDAYRETGNGLKGLHEQFDEFFADMVQKQLLNKGVDAIMAPFYEEWNSKLTEGDISDQDAAELKALKEEYMNKLDKFLTVSAEQLDLDTDNVGDLGTLQKGIQGITEDQADVLASYLNSIRFFVAEQTAYLKMMALGNQETTESSQQTLAMVTDFDQQNAPNPMLDQLKLIAENTTSIRTLLNGLLSPHNQGGMGLKVIC